MEKAEKMAIKVVQLLESSLAKADWKPQSRQQISKENKEKKKKAEEVVKEGGESLIGDGVKELVM